MGFGLIPEFIGRLPVLATVDDLDLEDLVQVLTEPKNALTKQYAKFFEMDGVELVLTEGALLAIAEQALMRGTGARGLRAIMEEVLLETMYELPARADVAQVLIDEDVVRERVNPTLVPDPRHRQRRNRGSQRLEPETRRLRIETEVPADVVGQEPGQLQSVL